MSDSRASHRVNGEGSEEEQEKREEEREHRKITVGITFQSFDIT